MSTIITSTIFIFVFIPLILAEFARVRSVPTTEDFFVCNRGMSTFFSFFTIYATWYSIFAVIGSGASFYSNGPVYMTSFAWNALFAISIYILGKRMWFYGKKYHYITPVDFFKDIYCSKALNLLVVTIFFIFTVPYIQIQFSGCAYLIDIASGGQIPWKVAGLVFYVVMIVYLWAGGLRAVAFTDIFYSLLIFITMLGIGLLIISKVGSMTELFNQLIKSDPESVLIYTSTDKINNVTLWITMFLVTPLGAIMSPPMWIRCYSIEKSSTFSLLPFLITIAAIGYIGCLIAGTGGRILNPGLTNTDILIPTVVSQSSNKIFTTLFFCGFASASLSTANSQIHALSAIYTIDIHKTYINKKASDTKLLSVAKWCVLIFSFITYFSMISNPSLIINTGLIALSGTLQILVPTAGAFFWKKSNAFGAFIGLLAGIITLLTAFFIFKLESSLCGLIGLAVNTLLFIVGSLNTNQNPVTREKIVFYRDSFNKSV